MTSLCEKNLSQTLSDQILNGSSCHQLHSNNKRGWIGDLRHHILTQSAYGLDTRKDERTLLDRLLNGFEWHDDATSEIKDNLNRIIRDLFKRRGYKAARAVAQILERYQSRIAKYKFDIGCIKGIEYAITPKATLKPRRPPPAKNSPEAREGNVSRH